MNKSFTEPSTLKIHWVAAATHLLCLQ